MKTLVIYYSFSGNTKLIANTIATELNADVLELKPPKTLINETGFMRYLWGGGQVIMQEKPKLLPFNVNPLDYDLIFIGTPVWAFSFAPPFKTFFSTTKLTNKKIALFCTHAGAMGKTLDNMKQELSNNTIVGEINFFEPLKSQTKEKIILTQKWSQSIFLSTSKPK